MEEEKQEKVNYEYEDILQMFGGYKYFSEAQCRYVYHKLKGDHRETEYYLQICNEETKKLSEFKTKLKSEDEINEINRLNNL